jgi:hypothetical protein
MNVRPCVEAQFLGRSSAGAPKDLPPFWSTQIHGVPYNEGDPLDKVGPGALCLPTSQVGT